MPDEALPRLTVGRDEDAVRMLLYIGRQFISQRPEILGPLVRGLIAEGKQFAETDDGEVWMVRLSDSRFIRQGRLLWHAAGLDAFVRDEPCEVPSELISGWIESLGTIDLDTVFTSLLEDMQ